MNTRLATSMQCAHPRQHLQMQVSLMVVVIDDPGVG